MITIGIVGATGYTGVELMRLVAMHPDVELKVVTSNTEKNEQVIDVFPNLRSHINLKFDQHDTEKLNECDLVLFATPHATAMKQVPRLLEKDCRVIDLSADFRIQDPEIWETWYGVKHACPEIINTAVYGLPELYRDKIKDAKLVANPGCYPTAIILALLPAIKNSLIDIKDIIADAKSGISGAGRKATLATQFSEIAESFKAYSVSGHRHLPEMLQTLKSINGDDQIELTFTPHLVPMNRGIFATVYVKPNDHTVAMQKVYTDYYEKELFVDLMPPGSHPDTLSVRATNMCRISLHPGENEYQHTIILSVIDNLVKGAAGQAIQNMNLMYGFDEATGLLEPGLIP